MKRLLFVLFVMLSLASIAQKKVAVYVTGEQSGINKVLGDQLVDAFTRSGKYIAIERTDSFLAELSREQNYQRTGAVSDNDIARLGNQFGVQYVCVASVSELFGENYVSARLIDVETAEVINSANSSSAMKSMDDLMKVTSSITSKLTGKTAKELADEAAAKKAEEERAAKEREKFFEQAIAAGYIRVGNLYATFDPGSGGYDSAKYCTLGGWSDWRLPSSTELSMIARQYSDWSNESYKYSSNVRTFLSTLYSEIKDKEFRVNEGRYMKCVTIDGRSGNGFQVYTLFVRNIKE